MPQASERTEARYFAILDVAADAIISVDEGQRITVFNQGAEAIFACRAADVLGEPLDLLIPERFREMHRRHFADFIRGPDGARRMAQRQAIQGLRRDGSEFPAAASISKVNIDGEIVLTVMLRDMSESVRSNAAISDLNLELAQRAAELGLANAQLTRLSAMQRAILDFAGYGIAATDLDGTMVSFNPAAEQILGYTADEIIGRQTPLLWHDANEIALRATELSRELGTEIKPGFEVFTVKARQQLRDDREWTFRRKDGTRLSAQLAITALRDAQGEVTGYLGIFSDISERKRAEQTAREQERRFRAIFDQTYQFTGLLAPDGTTLEVNRTALDFIGAERDDSIGRPFWDTPWWSGAKEIQAQLREALAEARRGSFVRYEVNLPGRDGLSHTIDFSLKPVRDERGEVVLIIPEGRDITERKQAEEAVRDLNRELAQHAAELGSANAQLTALSATQRAILDFAGYAIISSDREGRILTFNPAAERMLGHSAAEVVGKKPGNLWHDAGELAARARTLSRELGIEVPPDFRVLTQLADRNLRDEQEWTFIRKDGTRVPVLVSITALRDAEGEITGYLGIALDISERKRSEEAIQALNRDLAQRAGELEALNRELEAFSYSVSHDLRAPLRSIDGFSQVLLEDYADKLDAEGRDYLARVRAASQRMAHLIDDLLNLSRLTRGEMRHDRVDLSALARAATEELAKSQPERAVALSIEDGIKVQGDARLLRVLLDNLLGNAWKYTSKHARASIAFGREAAADGRLVCYVRDDGAGFDPAYADKLFGAFQRLHGSAEFPGNGIGLVTAQRIVHRHGGEIWAEGAVEQGATFHFSLPA